MRATTPSIMLMPLSSLALQSSLRYVTPYGLSAIFERQPRECVQDNPTCVSCYGAGSIQCVGNSCYNPTESDTCCANGSEVSLKIDFLTQPTNLILQTTVWRVATVSMAVQDVARTATHSSSAVLRLPGRLSHRRYHPILLRV